jgi:hypothetical protein
LRLGKRWECGINYPHPKKIPCPDGFAGSYRVDEKNASSTMNIGCSTEVIAHAPEDQIGKR